MRARSALLLVSQSSYTSTSTSPVMMTVSAFGSSMVRVYPIAVLVVGTRRVTVNDVNSRYLNFYTTLIYFDTLYSFQE